MKRIANARWQGSGMDGNGVLNTKSGVFKEQPYSFKTRFKNEDGTLGTNPEELISASHAGCFNMALSFQLGGAGFTPEELNTEAIVSMENIDGHFQITEITLNLKAKIPNIEYAQFETIANNAKANCPISKALSAVNIYLKASLL